MIGTQYPVDVIYISLLRFIKSDLERVTDISPDRVWYIYYFSLRTLKYRGV